MIKIVRSATKSCKQQGVFNALFTNLSWSSMSTNKIPEQGQKNQFAPKEQYFQPHQSFDVIAHYDQICKCQGQGGSVSILPSYPLYQSNAKNQVAVKARYKTNPAIYLIRFQFATAGGDGSQKDAKDSVNFPVSYDNLSELLYFTENGFTTTEIEAQNKKIQVTVDTKTRRVEFQITSFNNQKSLSISLNQYKILMESMKQGLCIVLGWHIPQKFLTEIEFKKPVGNGE